MAFTNPVAGAGETLGAFMVARSIAKLKGSAEEGWATAELHAEARLLNANRAMALKAALMDITAITSEEADAIASFYLRSETVRATAQDLAYKIYGSPKPKKQVPYGYGTPYDRIKEQHRQVLERFGVLGITPKRPPMHRDLEAARAVLDSERLAEGAGAEKERQDAARAEAVRQDILRRQAESSAKWDRRMGFVKGLFGFGGRSKGEPEPAAKPASNTNASPGPRPE